MFACWCYRATLFEPISQSVPRTVRELPVFRIKQLTLYFSSQHATARYRKAGQTGAVEVPCLLYVHTPRASAALRGESRRLLTRGAVGAGAGGEEGSTRGSRESLVLSACLPAGQIAERPRKLREERSADSPGAGAGWRGLAMLMSRSAQPPAL